MTCARNCAVQLTNWCPRRTRTSSGPCTYNDLRALARCALKRSYSSVAQPSEQLRPEVQQLRIERVAAVLWGMAVTRNDGSLRVQRLGHQVTQMFPCGTMAAGNNQRRNACRYDLVR